VIVLLAVPCVLAFCRRAKLERAPEAHHGQAVVVQASCLRPPPEAAHAAPSLSPGERAGVRASDSALQPAHAAPTPRLGGLALVAAFIAVDLFAGMVSPAQREAQSPLPAAPNAMRQAPSATRQAPSALRLAPCAPLNPVILLSCLAMFGLGFMDDLKPLGARKKLLGQVLISLAVCVGGLGIENFTIPFTGHFIHLGPWGVLITVLWLVGMTNLINLIDGVDGLAAGIALMLMVLLGYVGHQSGSLELFAAGMGGALLGFLCFNFPPARIYMGDGGAYFLGFQIGLFAIVDSHKGEVLAALAAPLFVLALPILDTGLALLRRGLRGLPIFRPDRRHLHHHLLDSGLSRRKVVLCFYGVTLAFLILGMVAYSSRGHLVPVLLGLTVLILLLCAGRFRFSRRWFAVGRMVRDSMGMRSEIQYALCLCHWLALEGRRGKGVENLWSTLVTASDKLGFASVKLTLPDGERLWTREAEGRDDETTRPRTTGPQPDPLTPNPNLNPNPLSTPPEGLNPSLSSFPSVSSSAPALRSARHSLLGGRCGILELQAPCAEHETDSALAPPAPCASRLADEALFETVGELLAEAWVKAAANYINGDHRPLLFSSAPIANRQSPIAEREAPCHPSPLAPRPSLNPEVGI